MLAIETSLTIVNVALPQIRDGRHLILSEAESTNSPDSLVFAALRNTVGSMADRYGRRRLTITGA